MRQRDRAVTLVKSLVKFAYVAIHKLSRFPDMRGPPNYAESALFDSQAKCPEFAGRHSSGVYTQYLFREEVWIAMPDAPTSTSKTSTPKSTRSSTSLAKRKSREAARYAAAHWLAVILAVIAVVFVAQNRHEISIDFFWATLTSPMWLVLLITVLGGTAIGYLISRHRQE